jgi:phosphatidylserine/phosphatidylglycerophosphate/cardiolipin synthase-like enzyme
VGSTNLDYRSPHSGSNDELNLVAYDRENAAQLGEKVFREDLVYSERIDVRPGRSVHGASGTHVFELLAIPF